MMPPDIDAMENDISKCLYVIVVDKLGALTPNPMQNNLGWGFENMGYDP